MWPNLGMYQSNKWKHLRLTVLHHITKTNLPQYRLQILHKKIYLIENRCAQIHFVHTDNQLIHPLIRNQLHTLPHLVGGELLVKLAHQCCASNLYRQETPSLSNACMQQSNPHRSNQLISSYAFNDNISILPYFSDYKSQLFYVRCTSFSLYA